MHLPGSKVNEQNFLNRLSLEHPLVDHCNLRCANCDHGSPAASAKFSDVAQFRRDLATLSRVLRVETLKLVGGEPLLHPDLLSFLRAAKECGIARRVQIWTNGLLLHRLRPGELNDCDDLVISVYPGIKQSWDSNVVKHLSRTAAFRVLVKETNHFMRITSDLPRSVEKILSTFQTCKNAHEWSCHSFANGIYYKCSRAQFLSSRANPEKQILDGVQISEDASFGVKLGEYLNSAGPLTACATCLGTSGPLEPHRQHRVGF